MSATNADIIQLSAAHGQDEFNTYIMPEKEITPGASQVTNLAVVKGRLCLRGKPVHSKSAKEGFKSFVEWLKAKEVPVVLFAHNVKSSHCKYNIFSPEMCSTKSNPSCFPSRRSYVTAISRFQSCSVMSPNSVTLEFDDNSIAIYALTIISTLSKNKQIINVRR